MNKKMLIAENSGKTILCLYETSGTFSRLYHELGYNIVQIDIQNKEKRLDRWTILNNDCRLIENIKDVNVVGIIAHPPCTVFANSGSRWRKEESELPATNGFHKNLLDQKLQEALSMVDVVFRLINIYQPDFWFLENPVGKLSKFIGKHDFIFDPYEFSGYLNNPKDHLPWVNFKKKRFEDFIFDPYSEAFTKKTLLWGKFNRPSHSNTFIINGDIENIIVVDPEYVVMKHGKKMSKMHYNSLKLNPVSRANVRSLTPKGFAIAFVKNNLP